MEEKLVHKIDTDKVIPKQFQRKLVNKVVFNLVLRVDRKLLGRFEFLHHWHI